MEKKSLKRFSRKANITLSIPEDILKQLRLDADSENISVKSEGKQDSDWMGSFIQGHRDHERHHDSYGNLEERY